MNIVVNDVIIILLKTIYWIFYFLWILKQTKEKVSFFNI